jgi:hypothetical protein
VHQTQLHRRAAPLGVGKQAFNGIPKAAEIINTADQNIFYTPALQVSEYG